MLQASSESGTGVSTPPIFGSWDTSAGVLDHPFANYRGPYSDKSIAQQAMLQNLRSNPFRHVFCMVQVPLKMGFLRSRGEHGIFSAASSTSVVPSVVVESENHPPPNWPFTYPLPAFVEGSCDKL